MKRRRTSARPVPAQTWQAAQRRSRRPPNAATRWSAAQPVLAALRHRASIGSHALALGANLRRRVARVAAREEHRHAARAERHHLGVHPPHVGRAVPGCTARVGALASPQALPALAARRMQRETLRHAARSKPHATGKTAGRRHVAGTASRARIRINACSFEYCEYP